MSNFKDLSNQRFGYLVVQKLDYNPNNKSAKWLCKCDCGNYATVRGADLKTGHTSSCGCKKHEPSHVVHYKQGTRIYNIWKSMKNRCYNKNERNFKNYGGRNINVCNEWKNNFQSFYDWSIQHGYSDNLTIDRIDVNGNYEPSNCRWITMSEQSINKTNTVYIEINGISKPLKEWTGIKEIKQSGFFNKNAVLNCCYGLSITHKGFVWRYKNDNYPKYKSK